MCIPSTPKPIRSCAYRGETTLLSASFSLLLLLPLCFSVASSSASFSFFFCFFLLLLHLLHRAAWQHQWLWR
jgi:uncharacterized membrane protein